ncbi:hypothetical protein Bbelb_199960 [Branchiostoma belcheri]|nr:hypothetical protein Bbelb_199960 [Branchiostoma belcheri]
MCRGVVWCSGRSLDYESGRPGFDFGSYPNKAEHAPRHCSLAKGHKIGGMSELEPRTSWFRVEHSAHDPTLTHTTFGRTIYPGLPESFLLSVLETHRRITPDASLTVIGLLRNSRVLRGCWGVQTGCVFGGSNSFPRPVQQAVPVTIIGLLIATAAIGGSTRQPFFPFLTHDFFPYLNSNQIGYYTGFLTSATFFGTFLGCFVWGKLSDVVGRRPILLSSNATLMISMVLIGFSFSFPWTVCVLFLEGLFNGTVVVAKTYLYEGPTLGGFLSCPATRFEVFDIPLFKQFPYLLPCAVVACLQFCILIVGCLFLTESLGKKLKEEYIDLTEVSTDSEEDGEKRQEDSIMGILRDRLVLISCVVYAVFALASICINQTLLALLLVSDPDHGGYSFGPAEVSVVLTTIAVYGTVTKASINPYIASKFTYKTVYVIGLVLYAVGISLLPSMSGITGVGAVASRKLSNQTASSSDFTLNFTTAERISTTSPQVMTESYIQKAAEMNTTAARPLPGQCRIADDKEETSQRPASDLLARVWAPLLFVVLVMEQGRAFSFLAGMVLVGNASVQSNRGTINSIAQILASLMRLAGPVTSANLFAWSNDNETGGATVFLQPMIHCSQSHVCYLRDVTEAVDGSFLDKDWSCTVENLGLPWPLDHHLGFYVVAVLCLLMAVLCASLPASINKPRVALDSPTASEGSDGAKGQGK